MSVQKEPFMSYEEPQGASQLTVYPFQALPFEFTGRADEYFKVWIVNIVLTVITLGVYSAWAKVRNKQYFYGNTRLQQASFEYLANPLMILKGRGMVLGVFVIFGAISSVYPFIEGTLWFLFFLATPWLVVRALEFRARNTSHRHIRFAFQATYREAGVVYVLWPLLLVLLLGLAYPYFSYLQHRFVVNHSGFGTTPFELKLNDNPVRRFYGVYIAAACLAMLFTMMGLVPVSAFGLGMTGFMGIAMGVFLAMAYIQTHIANLVWSHTWLGNHRLESTLATEQMAWLYFSNALAVVLTVGLLIPWASIRMTRYRLAKLTLWVEGNLDEFAASESQAVTATGEELAGFFDVEAGL